MKPVYLMIGPALLGACLSCAARTRTRQSRIARHQRKRPWRPAAGGADRADDTRAIGALVDAFTKAFNAGDAAAVAATFTAGALVVDEEGEPPLDVQPSATSSPRRQEHPGQHDRDPGRLPAVPRLGDGTRGGPGHHHSGQWRRGTRDQPLHRHLRQGRRPLASGRRSRRTGPQPDRPRPPQGAGVAGWGMGQREPGGGCLHHLQVGRQRQFPAPRVHSQDPGQARDERLQRIGWDPVKRQFKSWVFDTEGGFVEAYWTRDGNQGWSRPRACSRTASPRRPRISSRVWARTESAGSRSTAQSAARQCPGSMSSPSSQASRDQQVIQGRLTSFDTSP